MSIDVEKIRGRLEAAGAGEWVALTDPGDRKTAPAWIVDADAVEVRLPATYLAGRVAEFIAHAPSDITVLLGEVAQLRATNARLNRRAQVAEAAVNAFQNDGKREGLRSDAIIHEYWTRAEEARGALAALTGAEQHECGGNPVLEPPAEPGMVRYQVEVIPHDWANEGQSWEIGTQSPAHVARALRAVADQVEYFTGPTHRGGAE